MHTATSPPIAVLKNFVKPCLHSLFTLFECILKSQRWMTVPTYSCCCPLFLKYNIL